MGKPNEALPDMAARMRLVAQRRLMASVAEAPNDTAEIGYRRALDEVERPKTAQHARDVLLDMLPKHSTGAEIGVWRGEFSDQILATVEPKLLYLIDPWKVAGGGKASALYGCNRQTQESMDATYEAVRERFASQPVAILRAPSGVALDGIPDGSLDWVYIDGDHTLEGVTTDLWLALKKVRVGGIIAGDDYGIAGWWDHGVTHALHRFLCDASERLRVRLVLGTQFALVVR